jgi:hypothetical protein
MKPGSKATNAAMSPPYPGGVGAAAALKGLVGNQLAVEWPPFALSFPRKRESKVRGHEFWMPAGACPDVRKGGYDDIGRIKIMLTEY